MPGGDAREAAKTVTGSFEDFPYPARAARPRPRRRHDRPHRRDARRAVRARGAQRLADRRPAGPGHPAGPVLARRGPRRAGGVHPGLRGPAEGAGRRALDAGRRPGAAERRGRALRPGRLPRPRRLARRGAARAPRGGAPPGARRPASCSSSTSRPSPPCCAARSGPPAATAPTGPSTGRSSRARCGTSSAVHGGGPVVVHSCAPDVPFALLRRAGAAAVSFDFSLLTERDDDAIGEAVEGGTRLFAGVVPGHGRPHCQTLPVASWVSGRCGAGWGCIRGFSRRRSWSLRRADSRALPRVRARGARPLRPGGEIPRGQP